MKKLTNYTNDLLRSLGYRVTHVSEAFAHKRSKAIAMESIDLVVDIGANAGQYGKQLRRYGYRGQICSFEPLAKPFEELQFVARRDKLWSALNLAVGDRAEKLPINVAANSESSSLFPMLEAHLQAAPNSRYVSTEIVDVIALDTIYGNQLPKAKNPMLKIDTQGYEANVIRGAGCMIADTKLIECELSFVPLYEGQLLFQEMFLLITKLGFTPVAFESVFADPLTGRCLQVDVLFVRNA